MKTIVISVGFLVAAVIVLLLLTKNFHCGAVPAVESNQETIKDLTRKLDSADQVVALHDARAREDSMELRFQIDSLESDLFNARQALRITQTSAARLRDKINAARAGKDTAGYHVGCDSLANEVDGLNQLVDNEVHRSDSIKARYIQLERITAARLASQQKLKDQYKAAIAAVDSAAAADMAKIKTQLKKVQKKAAKTVTIGVGIGYGITPDGRVAPQANINISKTLVRLW